MSVLREFSPLLALTNLSLHHGASERDKQVSQELIMCKGHFQHVVRGRHEAYPQLCGNTSGSGPLFFLWEMYKEGIF